LAISSAEVTLPTLNMNSSELNELSLSGIINTMGITPDPAMQVVQVDSNTIQGQNQPITFHLQPMDEQGGPIRDVRDNIQGFNQAQSTTPNPAYQEFQNLLSNKVTPVEQKPFVRILEQPASHKLRFRYKCEGRGAGALQGERSTPEKKTFPKIQIVGYKGPAVVVVSCVTHDSEVPKTHPHNLVSPASVGRDGCKKGVCTMNVNNDEMSVEFPHLGIQCVRRRDIADALKQRQEIRVDPYRQGFGHVDSPNSIDLNAVKLCFQILKTQLQMEGKMQPPSGAGAGGRKRQNLTLDLNSASPKKNKVQNLLTSPDVQMLKLTSPELEKFLSQNPSLATPTPSGFFPKSVTEEQMMYAKGFEEALEKMRRGDEESFNPVCDTRTVTAANTLVTLSSGQVGGDQHHTSLHLPLSLPNPIPNNPLSRPNSGASGSYDSDTYQLPEGSIKIKDEPEDGSLDGEDDEESLLSPGASGVSPIDMETQEKIKLERKRLRNRQAAAKCRKRKLERISQLDERVAQLKTENTDLAAVVKKMKSSVASLKQEVMDHVNSGCEIRMSDASVFS